MHLSFRARFGAISLCTVAAVAFVSACDDGEPPPLASASAAPPPPAPGSAAAPGAVGGEVVIVNGGSSSGMDAMVTVDSSPPHDATLDHARDAGQDATVMHTDGGVDASKTDASRMDAAMLCGDAACGD